MQQFYYIFALLVSITGLATLDRRFQLAFWNNRKKAMNVMVLSVIFFVAWDLLGIALGIFFHGESNYTLPIRIVPEFPVEELLFLFVLNYSALLLYLGGTKLWPRT
ncbi:MAG TPA: lycopene cyclase domain-containing protein [Candidatus Saccharibacteria bacterium]|jgi:lycopene cyclase domain-containing protein|nr:lycopene cyclase domain-containing protein [Candidatus Saccharibacteria bacterium]